MLRPISARSIEFAEVVAAGLQTRSFDSKSPELSLVHRLTKTKTRHQRHAPHRPPAHRPLFRRPAKLGPPAKRSRLRLLLLHSRLARANQRLRRYVGRSAKHYRNHHRLSSQRPGPRRKRNFSPVVSPRTRRTPPSSLNGHPARLARTRPHLQRSPGEYSEQRSTHVRLSGLSNAANRRHRDLQRRRRAVICPCRRRPSFARGTEPRNRETLQWFLLCSSRCCQITSGGKCRDCRGSLD